VHLQWKQPRGDRVTLPQEYLLPPDDLAAQEKAYATENTVLTELPNIPTVSSVVAVGTMTQLVKNWVVGGCGSGAKQLQEPHGIAVDADGNIYVADTGNRRIVRMNSQGEAWSVFDSSGLDPNLSKEPFDIAIDSKGEVIVLDSDSGLLEWFSAAGKLIKSMNSPSGSYHPRGIAVNPQGEIAIADTGGSRILKVSEDSQVLANWSTKYPDKSIGQPTSVGMDSAGSVYWLDADSGIARRAQGGNMAANWLAVQPSDTVYGSRLAVAADGTVFITKINQNSVVQFMPDGTLVGEYSIPPINPDTPFTPNGIAVHADGTIYLTDPYLCQIGSFSVKK
jgi:streptogramin lyase